MQYRYQTGFFRSLLKPRPSGRPQNRPSLVRNSGQRSVISSQRSADLGSPSARCLPPTAFCPLPTAFYLLPTALTHFIIINIMAKKL
jgi:hypothetical protein